MSTKARNPLAAIFPGLEVEALNLERFASANPTAMDQIRRRMSRPITGKNKKAVRETLRENTELLATAAKELAAARNPMDEPGALLHKIYWHSMDDATQQAYLNYMRDIAPGNTPDEKSANAQAMVEQFQSVMNTPVPPEVAMRLTGKEGRPAVGTVGVRGGTKLTSLPPAETLTTTEGPQPYASARSTEEARKLMARGELPPPPEPKELTRRAIPEGERVVDIITKGDAQELLRPEERSAADRMDDKKPLDPKDVARQKRQIAAAEKAGKLPTSRTEPVTEQERAAIVARLEEDIANAQDMPEREELVRRLLRQRINESFKALSAEGPLQEAVDPKTGQTTYASAGETAPTDPSVALGFDPRVFPKDAELPNWADMTPEDRAAIIAANDPTNDYGDVRPVGPLQIQAQPDYPSNRMPVQQYAKRVADRRAAQVARLLEENERLKKLDPVAARAQLERIKQALPEYGGSRQFKSVFPGFDISDYDVSEAEGIARMVDAMLEDPIEVTGGTEMTGLLPAASAVEERAGDVGALANPAMTEREAEKFGFKNAARRPPRRQVAPFDLAKIVPDLFQQNWVFNPKTNKLERYNVPTDGADTPARTKQKQREHAGLMPISLADVLKNEVVDILDDNGLPTGRTTNAYNAKNIAAIIVDRIAKARPAALTPSGRAAYMSRLQPLVEMAMQEYDAPAGGLRTVDPATADRIPIRGEDAPPPLGEMVPPAQQLDEYYKQTFADLPLFAGTAPPFEPRPGFFEGNVGQYGGDSGMAGPLGPPAPLPAEMDLSPGGQDLLRSLLAGAAENYVPGWPGQAVTAPGMGTSLIVDTPSFGPFSQSIDTESLARGIGQIDVADPQATPSWTNPEWAAQEARRLVNDDLSAVDSMEGELASAMPELGDGIDAGEPMSFGDIELLSSAQPVGDVPVSGSVTDLPTPPVAAATVADGLLPAAPPLGEVGEILASVAPTPQDLASATGSGFELNFAIPGSGAELLPNASPVGGSVQQAMEAIASQVPANVQQQILQAATTSPDLAGIVNATGQSLDNIRAVLAANSAAMPSATAAAPGINPAAAPVGAAPQPATPQPAGVSPAASPVGAAPQPAPGINPAAAPVGGGAAGSPFQPGPVPSDLMDIMLGRGAYARPQPFTPGPVPSDLKDIMLGQGAYARQAPPTPNTWSNLPSRTGKYMRDRPIIPIAGATVGALVAAQSGNKPDPYSAPPAPGQDPIADFFNTPPATPLQNPDASNELGDPNSGFENGRLRRAEDAIRRMLKYETTGRQRR